jgi:hypothetical protein
MCRKRNYGPGAGPTPVEIVEFIQRRYLPRKARRWLNRSAVTRGYGYGCGRHQPFQKCVELNPQLPEKRMLML